MTYCKACLTLGSQHGSLLLLARLWIQRWTSTAEHCLLGYVFLAAHCALKRGSTDSDLPPRQTISFLPSPPRPSSSFPRPAPNSCPLKTPTLSKLLLSPSNIRFFSFLFPPQGFPGWIIQVIRFIILINGTIPISLYITLEMIKVLQCTLMLNQDRKVSCTPFFIITEIMKVLQYTLMLHQSHKVSCTPYFSCTPSTP